MSFHYLSFIISIDKLTTILISVPLKVRYIFSIWLFSRFFFFFFVVFSSFTMMCLSMPWCLSLWKFFALIYSVVSRPIIFLLPSLGHQLNILFYHSHIVAANFLVFSYLLLPKFQPKYFLVFLPGHLSSLQLPIFCLTHQSCS